MKRSTGPGWQTEFFASMDENHETKHLVEPTSPTLVPMQPDAKVGDILEKILIRRSDSESTALIPIQPGMEDNKEKDSLKEIPIYCLESESNALIPLQDSWPTGVNLVALPAELRELAFQQRSINQTTQKFLWNYYWLHKAHDQRHRALTAHVAQNQHNLQLMQHRIHQLQNHVSQLTTQMVVQRKTTDRLKNHLTTTRHLLSLAVQEVGSLTKGLLFY
jgi:hypothetical protein